VDTVLETVFERGAREPDAVALRGRDCELNWSELSARVTAAAHGLAARQVRTLAVALDNTPEWVVVDLATQLAGVALVPLPPFFSIEQVQHVLEDSGADAVAVDALGREQLRRLDLEDAGTSFAHCELLRVPASAHAELPRGTAKISYTSGTTGRPKGVCHTQQVLDRVAWSLCLATASLDVREHLCLLPLATLLENVAGVYAPILAGAAVTLPGMRETGLAGATGLDVRQMLACMRSYRAQSVILLPQMLAALAESIDQGEPRPATLRFAAVGGGFVARTLLERADALRLPVYEGYGLTECASVVALNTSAARRIGSVGRPLPHVRVCIGEGSEVLVAGASMAGYVSGDRLASGEVATGDLGYLDDDGFLHISGRRKSIFITSFGRNVSPDWVEAEVVSKGVIAQAALFGEARPWNVAVVVPAAGFEATDAIQYAIDAANAGLPDYARIHRWVRAHEPFSPRNGQLTANGRNRRDAIRAHYGAEINAHYAERAALCS
jgi:long-chain acyl-CoA synthetase